MLLWTGTSWIISYHILSFLLKYSWCFTIYGHFWKAKCFIEVFRVRIFRLSYFYIWWPYTVLSTDRNAMFWNFVRFTKTVFQKWKSKKGALKMPTNSKLRITDRTDTVYNLLVYDEMFWSFHYSNYLLKYMYTYVSTSKYYVNLFYFSVTFIRWSIFHFDDA